MQDRLAEVFWVAVKAAAVTFVILLLLQLFPGGINGVRYLFWSLSTSCLVQSS